MEIQCGVEDVFELWASCLGDIIFVCLGDCTLNQGACGYGGVNTTVSLDCAHVYLCLYNDLCNCAICSGWI